MKEKLTKSRERVKKHGEVYTPEWLVKKMCDMLEQENPDCWSKLEYTFLEPSCGNGNFLVEILARKLKLCKNYHDGLTALSVIWGIDILEDNVLESREHMLNMYKELYSEGIDEAKTILEKQIIHGNSLEIMAKWAEEGEK